MYLPPLLLLLLLRLLRPLSPSDRDIDAARPGQSIGCGVEFSSFEPTTFRGKFHMYANAVNQDLVFELSLTAKPPATSGLRATRAGKRRINDGRTRVW
jgi:hypothetical protein